MLINGLVIGVVIWLVGVSVKDFACLLVGQYEYMDAEKQSFFNSTMHFYLVRASVIAVFVGVIIYYMLMKKIFVPLRKLNSSTRLMMAGQYPQPIEVKSDDEVGQLSHHFNQMVDSLQHAEQSRKQLLGDLSHELRTPLSNLNGYLEALSAGVVKGDTELYKSLHEESLHLTKLVDQLHQLAVWEMKQASPPEWSIIDMNKLIHQACSGFELELANKHSSCKLTIEPAEVEGNETGIRQVLINLIDNAIQYNISNWIHISGENLDHEYKITITNEGEPIPPSKAELIFNRMIRLDASRRREAGGSGLGLAIVNEIVKLHSGRSGLQSDGNRHSFWFIIPLQQPSSDQGRKEG